MAEFQEVMRQWRRMCGANNYCSACRMQKENLPYTLCSEGGIRSVENLADAELAIMAWAAEHPEPVYETWFEYLLRIGVIPENAPAGGEYQWIVESIKYKPIPADIAEKLGVEPKEG